MPTYTFKCPKDHITEKEFKISEKPETIKCPECKKVAKTVLTNGNFILKGKGWYKP